MVGGRAWAEAQTSAIERVTLYCTWRPSELTTRPHGQVQCMAQFRVILLDDLAVTWWCNRATLTVNFMPYRIWMGAKRCLKMWEYVPGNTFLLRDVQPRAMILIDCKHWTSLLSTAKGRWHCIPRA